LATAYDQPALGGVYKLSAIRSPGEPWQYKVKLSEQAIKVSNPGLQQVRRYQSDEEFIADAIYDADNPPKAGCTIVDPMNMTRRRTIEAATPYTDLLVPVFRHGKPVYDVPSLEAVRRNVADQLSRCHAGIKRFVNPHQYPVGLESRLYERKTRLILQARRQTE
jgi:nicotinate phosphoribosyltransferase